MPEIGTSGSAGGGGSAVPIPIAKGKANGYGNAKELPPAPLYGVNDGTP